MSISPNTAVNLYANLTGNKWPAQQTQQFMAGVSNAGNTSVTWAVNGTTGGNSTLGTVDNSGVYTAPSSVPNPPNVSVSAISQADATKSASDTVNVLQPTALGNFTVTVTATEGSKSHSQSVTLTVQ